MIRSIIFAVAVMSLTLAGFAQPAATAPDTANLPANQWVRLPWQPDDGPGYSWSGLIYEPARAQVLHWGGVHDLGRRPFAGRNDVRAFDLAAGRWSSDYPSTDTTYSRTGGGGGGQAPSYLGEALMRSDGTPRPDLHVFGVCYDSKRRQLVYTMPGLMATYDPAVKKWADMKAKTILYGQELPGAPPVHGVGTCYDPINDEIVLFPHFTAKNVERRDATGEISGHFGTFRYSFADNTWRRATEKTEPGPRCAAPMIYDPKSQCIVMFGGHNALVRNDLPDPADRAKFSLGLNDTWLYDCKTRQWRQLDCKNCPPRTRLPAMAYEPESGLFVLVTFARAGKDAKATLWSLDVAKAEWCRRDEQVWPGPYFGHGHTGGWTPDQMMTLDEKARTLIVVQPEGPQRQQATYLLKLDLAKLPSEPAPPAEPAPPIKPHVVAEDDPGWIEKLKSLPANTWLNARPKPETSARDWGSISVDPARGWVFYFGGGHSTYQVNDVAIYNVGSNRWSHHVGTHNDFIPICGWEGSTVGYLGGPPARHMRNQYQAFDGRMYRSISNTSSWRTEFFEPGYCLFYDFNAGGVWRERKIDVDNPTSMPSDFDNLQMTDPRGRILSIQLAARQRYDHRVARCVFRSFDTTANRLTVREVAEPYPQLNDGENRPFCYLPDRDAVLWVEHHAKANNHNTWLFDVKTLKWTNLKPKNNAPGLPAVVEYVEPAGCAIGMFNVAGKNEQWVYSLEKNDWAPLELNLAEGSRLVVQRPYGQMIWVQKFGVLVNCHSQGGTSVMRPDLSAVRWK